MKSLTAQTVNTLRQEGKTFQQIADMYGCSRQHVHQILNKKSKTKMKAPSKAELYAQVQALTKENIKLNKMLEAEERKRWREKTDQAFNMLYRKVPYLPREMYNTTLDHIDKAGYWFTFELCNDSTRQTYCVRHTDLL